MRAVIDTNVWVSALLNPNGPPAAVLSAVRRGSVSVVTSQPLLEELADILARPRIAKKYGVTSEDVAELTQLIAEHGETMHVTGSIHLCRDQDDDAVIETAVKERRLHICVAKPPVGNHLGFRPRPQRVWKMGFPADAHTSTSLASSS